LLLLLNNNVIQQQYKTELRIKNTNWSLVLFLPAILNNFCRQLVMAISVRSIAHLELSRVAIKPRSGLRQGF